MVVVLGNLEKEDIEAVAEFPLTEAGMVQLAEFLEIPVLSMEKNCEVILCNDLHAIEHQEANIDELNYLAKRLESFWGNEMTVFKLAAQMEFFREAKDLINLSFNINNYFLMELTGKTMKEISNDFLVTKYEAVSVDRLRNDDMKEFIEFFDSGAERDISDQGVLFKLAKEFQMVYDGKHFPPYFYSGNPTAVLLQDVNDEKKMEFFELPCEDITVEKALFRLYEDGVTDIKLTVESLLHDDVYEAAVQMLKDLPLKEQIEKLNQVEVAFEQTKGENKMDYEKMRRNIAVAKALFPAGTRLQLIEMEDPDAVPVGTRGTVTAVDDGGNIHMSWDNGRGLALIYGEDKFRHLTQEELAEEKMEQKQENEGIGMT